jgi:hypothetical protein
LGLTARQARVSSLHGRVFPAGGERTGDWGAGLGRQAKTWKSVRSICYAPPPWGGRATCPIGVHIPTRTGEIVGRPGRCYHGEVARSSVRAGPGPSGPSRGRSVGRSHYSCHFAELARSAPRGRHHARSSQRREGTFLPRSLFDLPCPPTPPRSLIRIRSLPRPCSHYASRQAHIVRHTSSRLILRKGHGS